MPPANEREPSTADTDEGTSRKATAKDSRTRSAAAGGSAEPGKPEKSEKSEQTRALILETAMRLFQERGYDKTTMRAIAQEAGVSVGNAYYYFAGKEHLIQGFYDRIAAEHQAAVRPVLAKETDLQARLSGVLQAWLDIAEPYHEFAAQFFKNAADPDSPLSPFSTESTHAREAAIDVHRELLAGSKAKVPPELRDILPEMMWLSQMGLVLYWVFDRSPGRERTRRLADRGARVTSLGVALARFRVLRPLVREVHELFTDFLPGMTPEPAKDAEVGAADGRDTQSETGSPGAVAEATASAKPGRAGRTRKSPKPPKD